MSSPYNAPKTFDHNIESNDIDQLNVSASWKKKFHRIERAGGFKLPKLQDLSFGERFGLMFNIWGFLFTFIYLFIKGMWRQALIAIGIWVILGIVSVFVSPNIVRGLGIGFGAFISMRVAPCYYRVKVLNDKRWFI